MASDPVYMHVQSPSSRRRQVSTTDAPAPDDPFSTPGRSRRVARSRSTQGRYNTLPHHTRSQIFDTASDDQEQFLQQMHTERKQTNAEIHQLKQQLGDAKQRITLLERKNDQQTRELFKVKSENEKHVANVKSLNDQIRQMKQDRARSQDRAPRASSSAGQFERRSNSVRRLYPGESLYSRGKLRQKAETGTAGQQQGDKTFPKQALNDLMTKCSEEFGLIKSQLKTQEAVFQGFQRGLSVERLTLPDVQNSQTGDSKTDGSHGVSNGQTSHDKSPCKSSSMDSILCHQEYTNGSSAASNSRQEQTTSSGQTKIDELSPAKQDAKQDAAYHTDSQEYKADLKELKEQLQEQQNLIQEQWRLIKDKDEAMSKEKGKLDNEWKFRTDELEIQLKETEENLRRERDKHTQILSNVQSESVQNKNEMRKRLDELVHEIKNLSVKQSKSQENASVLEAENANLKCMLKEFQQKVQQQMQQQAQQQAQQLREQNNQYSNQRTYQETNSQSVHPPVNQPRNQSRNHMQPRTPSFSRRHQSDSGSWVVPSIFYEDERLTKMVTQLLAKLDVRAELLVLDSHEITAQHSGRVLIPVIGSAGVANNIQGALEKAHIMGNVAVIILVFYPLAPHNCNLYTTTKNRIQDQELTRRCLAIIDLVVWHGMFYECEANDNGAKELRDIATS